MSLKREPEIVAYKGEDFTQITFKPDLAKFGMQEIDDDLEALLKKRVYDMAGTVKDIKVFLNEERIKIKSFKQYVDMALGPAAEHMVHEIVSDRWEVCLAPSDGQFQQISFVNHIATAKGGTHVNMVADQVVSKLLETLMKKNKNLKALKPFQIKNHLFLFVNCLIENPTFDSQTKEHMTLRASAFGSKCELSETFHKNGSCSLTHF